MSYLNGSPNGELYVGNVKWSNDYKHVIPFVDRAARNNFLENHLTKIKNNVIFINPNRYVDINGKISDVETLNYMYYKNDSDISNTRYCCFITDYEYIAPKTTRLYIELDVFQMYFYTATFYKSYIERGIVKPSTNDANKNYLPEPINAPLEFEEQLKQILNDEDWQPIWVLHSASYYNSTTGEYDYKGKGTHNTYGEYGRFIESQREIEQVLKMYGRQSIADTLAKLDDNIQQATTSGLNKTFWRGIIQTWLSGGISTAQGYTDMQGISALTDGLSLAQFQDHRDELIGLYAIPKWLKESYTADGGDANFADNKRIATSQISLPLNNSTLANGYTPRNKKLLTSVCRGYILANRTGLRIPFKPELFTGAATITLNGITMSTGGYQYNIGNYADKQQSFGEVAYNSERRVGYDANTGINKALNILTAAGQTAATLGGIAGGMATANPVTVISSGGAAIGGLTSAIDKIGQQEAHFGSNGDLLRITGTRPALRWFEVNPSYSECEAIDDFFDMYGYTIQQHKNPLSFIYKLVNGQYDRTQPTRPKWNYVKTQNVNLRCNAPAVYENQLKAIFDAGITLWHSYADFGDYSQDNINFN